MIFPNYLPFNNSTDYSAVYRTTLEMYSYLEATYGFYLTPTSSKAKTLQTAMRKMFIIPYNSAEDLGNIDRWKIGIEASYKSLYPLV